MYLGFRTETYIISRDKGFYGLYQRKGIINFFTQCHLELYRFYPTQFVSFYGVV